MGCLDGSPLPFASLVSLECNHVDDDFSRHLFIHISLTGFSICLTFPDMTCIISHLISCYPFQQDILFILSCNLASQFNTGFENPVPVQVQEASGKDLYWF